ncbi:MAG: response regulator [candidate division Zixibacteria bacterium]|jgi:CheY-like chemotaxis protein|nr:response regulator [candidate division Zixibacteria bacterium]
MRQDSAAKKASILVIDDDPMITRLVATVLESDGHVIHTANGGREGLSQARALSPDLIFVDITMPDMSGYEVTRQLKEDTALRDTPVIYLTGRPPAEDGGRSFSTGGLAFIRKPFSPRQLKDLVRVTLMSVSD